MSTHYSCLLQKILHKFSSPFLAIMTALFRTKIKKSGHQTMSRQLLNPHYYTLSAHFLSSVSDNFPFSILPSIISAPGQLCNKSAAVFPSPLLPEVANKIIFCPKNHSFQGTNLQCAERCTTKSEIR